METIVRNLCEPLSAADPRRMEKLMNILSLKDALALYMMMPIPYIEGRTMTGVAMSCRSKIPKFVIDWAREARVPPMNLSDDEIIDEIYACLGEGDNTDTYQEALAMKRDDRMSYQLEQRLSR